MSRTSLSVVLVAFVLSLAACTGMSETNNPPVADSGTTSQTVTRPTAVPDPTQSVSSVPTSSALVSPPSVPRVRPQITDFQAGVSILVYGNDPQFGIVAGKRLDRLVADNVSSVSLVFPITQATWQSNAVGKYDMTLSDQNITSFIRLAHDHGMSVLIRPLLDESSIQKDNPDQWRGTLSPEDKTAWFASYTATMVEFAKIAEKEHAEIFSLGFELNSLTGCQNRANWLSLISQVREVYHGKLIYSNNWDYVQDTCFWDQLDFIGVDAFYRLEVPIHPTEQQLVDGWSYAVYNINQASQKYGKPVIATEIGVRSEETASQHPWIWDNNKPVDLTTQKLFYSAVCIAVKGAVQGFYVWNTGLYDLPSPSTDRSFEFVGKPAEQALSNCYAQ